MACSMETNIIQLCTMKTLNGGKIFLLNRLLLINSTFCSNTTSTYYDDWYLFTALSWMLTQETLELQKDLLNYQPRFWMKWLTTLKHTQKILRFLYLIINTLLPQYHVHLYFTQNLYRFIICIWFTVSVFLFSSQFQEIC